MIKFSTWLFICVGLLVAFFIGFVQIVEAQSTYDYVKIRCDTLVGSGAVLIYIGDTTYKISIDCPASTL